jgi:hypothetical protein
MPLVRSTSLPSQSTLIPYSHRVAWIEEPAAPSGMPSPPAVALGIAFFASRFGEMMTVS